MRSRARRFRAGSAAPRRRRPRNRSTGVSDTRAGCGSCRSRPGPAHVEAVLDAADGVGEAAAAVGEADLQPGSRSSTPPKTRQQAARGARPASPPATAASIWASNRCPSCPRDAPGDRGAQFARGLEELEQFGASRFQPPTCEPICTPCSPSSSMQRSSSRSGERGRLQRHRCRCRRNGAGTSRQVPAMWSLSALCSSSAWRFGPVAEHHRHGGQHLHLHAEGGEVVDADPRVPGLGPDLAEELAVLVDAVAAVVAVVDHRKRLSPPPSRPGPARSRGR